MRPLRIFLADLKYFNRYSTRNNYIPLNVGYIASYVQAQFGKDVKISLYSDPVELLNEAKTSKPDIVGLAFYYWNTQLNQVVIDSLRKLYGENLTIVLGGPSIDSDPDEQIVMCQKYPDVDAFTVNEGELGFAEIVGQYLSDQKSLWKRPIDGAVFLDGETVVSGFPVGLTLDLGRLPSPYLNGLMDPFLDDGFMPMVQTSRLCPYTCTFCVSGKNRGKLRAFPLDQVKEELRFIAKHFADRSHLMLTISDENFGIIERDEEIADYILECSKTYSYPLSLFFYNDKKFLKTSRNIMAKVGHMVSNGLTFSLQTDSPDALKAINRKNLSDDVLREGISWAASINLQTTTELIFGLPEETKESFVSALSTAVDRGFDAVMCHNLLVMDGTELSRKSYRKKHHVETMLRPLNANYGYLNGQFVVERDEVVTSSDSFGYNDYLFIRGLNFLFYLVFVCHFYKPFFQFIRHLGVPLTGFFEEFLEPNKDKKWPKEYLVFLDDFWQAVAGELFADVESLEAYMKSIYDASGEVATPPRHNVAFSSRMIYEEKKWIDSVLKSHLSKYLPQSNIEDWKLTEQIIEFCARERIDLNEIEPGLPLEVDYDIIGWQRGKYSEKLREKKTSPRLIKFKISDNTREQLNQFRDAHTNLVQADFYHAALQIIVPRNRLLYDISYVE